VLGVIPFQGQDLTSSFAELHEVPVGPFLQPVQVPLDDSMTLWCTSYSLQFCICCKLAEGERCSVIQAIHEGTEQYWPQYQPLG